MADNISAPVQSQAVSTEASEGDQSQEVSQEVGSENQSGQEQQASAPKVAEVKKEIARIKKLKLKVDGKEYDEDLPFDLPDDPKAREYMTRQLQLAKMGQNRAQQYSALEKDVVTFLNEMKSNPKKALSNPNFGLDLKKLAADIIEEEIANSQKSPEQIKSEKLEQELQRLKDERETERQSAEKREFERLQEQEYQRYDTLVNNALEKGDLPKSPYVVKKIADYMLTGLQNGIDVTPDEVLPLVKKEILDDMAQMIGAMPDEAIEQFVGKDILNRLRKKNLAKAKTQPPQPMKSSIKDVTKTSLKPEGKPVDKKNFKQFFGV